jgi:hypothetical protein
MNISCEIYCHAVQYQRQLNKDIVLVLMCSCILGNSQQTSFNMSRLKSQIFGHPAGI